MAEQTVSGRAAELAPEPDPVLAEARGAEAVRAQLRELLDTQRRVVRVGEAQVEVVEALLLERLLEKPDSRS